MSKLTINYLRIFTLLGLFLALVGAVFAAPGSAAAASCSNPYDPMQACVRMSVEVYDSATGNPIPNAKVALEDTNGNVTYAYSIGNLSGTYAAYVTAGEYKISVSAPFYAGLTATVMVAPKEDLAKAPLQANSRIDRSTAISDSTGPSTN